MPPLGTSLAVQWLRLRTSSAGGSGLIPGRGTKIPHAVRHGQGGKKKNPPLWCGTQFQKLFPKKNLASPAPYLHGDARSASTQATTLVKLLNFQARMLTLSPNHLFIWLPKHMDPASVNNRAYQLFWASSENKCSQPLRSCQKPGCEKRYLWNIL